MGESSDRTNRAKPLRKSEAQRETRAIYSLTVQDIRGKDKRRRIPRSLELESQSGYLDHLKKTNPNLAESVVWGENLRQDITENGGPELYRLWENAWGKVTASMADMVDKAEIEIEQAIKLAQANSGGKLTMDGNREARGMILQIKRKLIGEAVNRMLQDKDIVDGFRGKEKLLGKCIAYLQQHAVFRGKTHIWHYLPK